MSLMDASCRAGFPKHPSRAQRNVNVLLPYYRTTASYSVLVVQGNLSLADARSLAAATLLSLFLSAAAKEA